VAVNVADFVSSIPPPLLALLALAAVLVLAIVVLTELSDWLRHRSFMRELRKNPELYRKYLESRTQPRVAKRKVAIPELIPKKVRVIVLRDESQLEDICKYDGETVTCKKLGMQFIVPAGFKPKPTYYRGKLTLTFYFDDKGNAITVKPDGSVEARAPDPRLADVIVNKKLIPQIFSRLRGDLSSIVMGMGLGAMIMSAVVFVLLPAIGVPVMIGRQPVEVIHVYQPAPAVPPPGNFTVSTP
jgi:hypothetical protein